jgi:hypothetical protein
VGTDRLRERGSQARAQGRQQTSPHDDDDFSLHASPYIGGNSGDRQAGKQAENAECPTADVFHDDVSVSAHLWGYHDPRIMDWAAQSSWRS